MKKHTLITLAAAAAMSTGAMAEEETGLKMPPPRPRWGDSFFTASLRFYGGASVKFSDLGTVPGSQTYGAATGSAVNRLYDDGNVYVDSTGNAGGTTRLWKMAFADQIVDGGTAIAMHSYSATPNGATAEADSGANMGWEVTYGRRLGDITRDTIWGLSGGFGFGGFRAEHLGSVNANLVALTDVYSLNGQAAPAAQTGYTGVVGGGTYIYFYSAPSTNTGGGDNTVALAGQPTRSFVTTPNGAVVKGTWKARGGFYTFRLGPWMRTRLSRRVSISTSVGASVTVISSRFTIDTKLANLRDVENVQARVTEAPEFTFETAKQVVVAGAYADANIEYWLTDRTGFYAGASFIMRGDMEQQNFGAKASVDLGKGLSLQLGLVHRF